MLDIQVRLWLRGRLRSWISIGTRRAKTRAGPIHRPRSSHGEWAVLRRVSPCVAVGLGLASITASRLA